MKLVRPWKLITKNNTNLIDHIYGSLADTSHRIKKSLSHLLMRLSEAFLSVCGTFPKRRRVSHHLLQHSVSSLSSGRIQLWGLPLSWNSHAGISADSAALVCIKSRFQSIDLTLSHYITIFMGLTVVLIQAAICLHQKISQNFLPTAIRFHYIFNLRDLTNIFQVTHTQPQNKS